VIDKNEHKFPKQLRDSIANFLKYSMVGYAYLHDYTDELHDLMLFLSKPIDAPSLTSNFKTDSFFADNFPEVSSNPVFGFFMKTMYNMKQKNYGAGEALLAMFFDDIEQAGKIGDFVLDKKHLEVKSVVTAASCKAHKDSSHRPSNDAFAKLYGEKEKGLKQFWDGSLSVFKEYCKIVYPHFPDSIIEEVHSQTSDSKCRQALGLHVLREYKKIDEFDNLIVVKPSDNNDISFMNVSDFSDDSFLKENIKFTPMLYRGNGTQALGDGYVDIKLK
jgi:hypothetical protein